MDARTRATDAFQSQFPEASTMDIVVGILWARSGTPLPLDKTRSDGRRYGSGTVYELETAASLIDRVALLTLSSTAGRAIPRRPSLTRPSGNGG